MKYYLTQLGREIIDEAMSKRQKLFAGALALGAGFGVHRATNPPTPEVITPTEKITTPLKLTKPKKVIGKSGNAGSYKGPGDTVPGGAAGHRVKKYKGPGDTVPRRGN